jgi:uncharacterized membrane protein
MAITDYPEADMYAHRSTAKLLKIFGVFMFFVGSAMGYSVSIGYGAIAVAISAVILWASTSLKLEALKWEVEQISQNLQDAGETGE